MLKDRTILTKSEEWATHSNVLRVVMVGSYITYKLFLYGVKQWEWSWCLKYKSSIVSDIWSLYSFAKFSVTLIRNTSQAEVYNLTTTDQIGGDTNTNKKNSISDCVLILQTLMLSWITDKGWLNTKTVLFSAKHYDRIACWDQKSILSNIPQHLYTTHWK